MKRYLVYQKGYVQVEVNRRFVVEVSDYVTEEKLQNILEEIGDDLLEEEEGMEWTDPYGLYWTSFDVDRINTTAVDPNTIHRCNEASDGMRVIKLDVANKMMILDDCQMDNGIRLLRDEYLFRTKMKKSEENSPCHEKSSGRDTL